MSEKFTTTPCYRCDGTGIRHDDTCVRCDGDGVEYEYTNPDYVQFVEDMTRAGYRVFHYGGRWGWSGPAVRTDRNAYITEQDVFRATSIPLQRDSMGLDLVLYPY